MIVDHALKNKLVLAHGGIMVFVWLIAVPFAVGANIYARKKRKAWGTKIHMLVMATAVLIPYTFSAILAFTVSGAINPKPHSGTGTAISFGLWFQVALGIINHLIFGSRKRSNRLSSKRPWNNHVHIWLGRALFILALINTGLGLKAKQAPTSVYIAFGIWVGLMFIIFAWLFWMKEEELKEGSTAEIVPELQRVEHTNKN